MLLKKMKWWKNHRTGTMTGDPLAGMLKGMEMFNKGLLEQMKNRTGPDNRKGKIGKLFDVRPGDRQFGAPRWVFHKFDKKPFDDAFGFIKALERRGFKVLGAGMFSTVLHKEGSNRVIKVIRRPDGWINYVHWAAQIGEAGRFAPKVFSYKKIKGREKDFAVAIVEKLANTLDNTPAEHAATLVPALVWRAEKNEMAAKFLETVAPGLLSFLLKMKEKWELPSVVGFDLHEGNLMIRTDGSFVVADPVSRGDDTFERLRAGDFSPAVALILIGFAATRLI